MMLLWWRWREGGALIYLPKRGVSNSWLLPPVCATVNVVTETQLYDHFLFLYLQAADGEIASRVLQHMNPCSNTQSPKRGRNKDGQGWWGGWESQCQLYILLFCAFQFLLRSSLSLSRFLFCVYLGEDNSNEMSTIVLTRKTMGAY